MCAAALSDLLSGEDLAIAFGELYAYAGVSIIIAPFLSGLMSSPRTSFAMSVIVSIVQLVVELKYLEETLPEKKRRVSSSSSSSSIIEWVNPFKSVIRLFTSSPRLALLSLITTMHYLVEPKNLSDISALTQLSFMGWSDRKRANFVSVIGFSFLAGGYISKRSVKRYGLLGHTKLCHVLSFLQFLLRAFCTSSSIVSFTICSLLLLVFFFCSLTPMNFFVGTEASTWAASFIALYSETRNFGVKALGTKYAQQLGIGKGEYAGLIASLRALMVFASPILFGTLFRRGAQMRPIAIPGLPFLGAMFGIVIGEIALRRLKTLHGDVHNDKELEKKEK